MLKIQKWGNGYGVRIPNSLIGQLGLPSDARFEVSQDAGCILLVPVQSVPTLEELLDGITPETLHGEADFVLRQGSETW